MNCTATSRYGVVAERGGVVRRVAVRLRSYRAAETVMEQSVSEGARWAGVYRAWPGPLLTTEGAIPMHARVGSPSYVGSTSHKE